MLSSGWLSYFRICGWRTFINPGQVRSGQESTSDRGMRENKDGQGRNRKIEKYGREEEKEQMVKEEKIDNQPPS
mgnify:FL=1